MIPFECPHCHLKTKVSDEYAGKAGACASCGKTISLPRTPIVAKAGPSDSAVPRWLKISLVLSAVCLCVFAGITVISWLVRPALVAARNEAHERTCELHLQQILTAMYAYEADHGTLPPAYTVDKSGKRLLSWRVLLLPYLGPEANATYRQIDQAEAWNGLRNAQFTPWCPVAFVCAADQVFAAGDTTYCVVTGPAFAFRGSVGVPISSMTDPARETLWLVEVANSGINWMEPRDVTAAQLSQGIGSNVVGLCGGNHTSGITHGGFADARVRNLADCTGNELIDLATIAGNEATDGIVADR